MQGRQRFEGRVAIVTGGAAGIGYETARQFAAEGAEVVIADIDEDRLCAAQAELGVDSVCIDLSQAAGVDALVQHTLKHHGRIDVLAHLAAIYPAAGIEDETFDGWRRIQQVNLDSTFLCCKAVLPHMRERGYGRIINTASSTVLNGRAGFSAYVASKAGVIGLSRVLAREAGPDGVTINVVMPGLIATQRVLNAFGEGADADKAVDILFQDLISVQAVKRRGEPEDVARAVLFLADEDTGFISGQILNVDGGVDFL